MTTAPPDFAIRNALAAGAHSPCRSKRGVVLIDPSDGMLCGTGFNGPPSLLGCPGRDRCGGNCGQRSVHAEIRALRSVAAGYRVRMLDLVHVELAQGPFKIEVDRDADGLPIGQAPHIVTGQVVACGGPICPGCAAQILDVGFVGGVWLYERVPEEHCPHLVELRRVDCPLCLGEDCEICRGALFRVCDHDVLDRHSGLRAREVRWRRYTAEEFYAVTLRNNGWKP
jgi:hypothetical protein